MGNEQTTLDLNHPSVEIQLKAIEQLGNEQRRESIPLLTEALKSPEWRVRKEASNAISKFQIDEDLTNFLINELKNSIDPGEKNAFFEILVFLGKKVTHALMTHYREMNADIKKICLDIFGETGDLSASYLLIQCLSDPNPNIQIAAIEALGKLKEPRSVDELIQFLTHENQLLSFAALRSLEQIGDTRAVEPIIRLLGKSVLDRPALKALGQLGDLSALNPIVNSLQNGTPKIKKAAIEAVIRLQEQMIQQNEVKIIGRLREVYNKDMSLFLFDLLQNSEGEEQLIRGTIRILGWMGEILSIQLLIPFLEGPYREEAIQAITRMKRGAVEPLLAALPKHEGVVREGMIRALGEIGDRKAVMPLFKMVSDPIGHVRQSLAIALGKLGDPVATRMLIQLLDDPYSNVQEAAIQSLRKFKDRTLILECITLLGHEKENVRLNSIRLIGLMKAKEAVPNLALFLKDQDPVFRKETLLALKAMENVNIEEWVIFALADEFEEVRMAALSCLEDRPEIRLDPFIENLKQDESIWVRSFLARLLGKVRTAASKKELIGLMSDPIGVVQISAMESLSHFHESENIPLFMEKMKSEDLEVQSAAIIAIGESGDFSSGEKLIGYMNHLNWNIRAAAIRALGKLKYKPAFATIEKLAEEDPDKIVRQSALYALELILG
ncbi:MAG: HEAT repeat domain-containing protein [Nitrospirae bacterium]|nr:HEAT repeat domain-containing protein [Nitrospirota bacterium]